MNCGNMTFHALVNYGNMTFHALVNYGNMTFNALMNYGNMAPYSTVALHTFSMQLHQSHRINYEYSYSATASSLPLIFKHADSAV